MIKVIDKKTQNQKQTMNEGKFGEQNIIISKRTHRMISAALTQQ